MSSAVAAQTIQERKKKPLLQYALKAESWVLVIMGATVINSVPL